LTELNVRHFFWFFVGLILSVGCSPASAETANSMKFTTDITWASKYMLNGFKVGGNSPVWQLAGKSDIYTSGFSLMFWTAIQADRQKKQYDEQDFFIMYQKDFLTDKQYAINLHGFYDYWVFPNTEPVRDEFGEVVSSSKKQGNKVQLGFSLPQLIPLFGSFVVPTLNTHYLHYYELGHSDLYRGGIHHEALLEYYKATPLFIPRATYQYSGVKTGVNYYDGAFGVQRGWSHTTASLVSGVYALKSIFELSLNQQWSYEETVNPENEFWTTFSFIKKF
jgi:hypothetical protein